jgi:hypothetical protein
VTDHKQVQVELNGGTVEVNEGIAALITALWERGLKTTGSCQHQSGTDMAWIAFETLEQAHEFERISGGSIITLEPEDYFDADGNPVSDDGGAAAVAFPHGAIDAVTKAVEIGGRVGYARPKPGRNDPCWCGSGKKFKRCHGA